MRPMRSGVGDEAEALRKLLSKARGILTSVRSGMPVLVRAPDEVAVARALRRAGATDEDMRRIRFTHDPAEE
jgi:hypothetical protein